MTKYLHHQFLLLSSICLLAINTFVFANSLEDCSKDSDLSAESQYQLALEHEKNGNYQKSFNCYLKAANKPFKDAQLKVGMMYEEGLGTPESESNAKIFYAKFITQNTPDLYDQYIALTLADLSVFVSEVYKQNKQYEASLFWNLRSAKLGSTMAKNRLGVHYQMGYGTPVDKKEALKWYLEAIDEGDKMSLLNIGTLYYIGGHGIERDYKQAYEWYLRSIREGANVISANHILGTMNEDGKGVDINLERAKKRYRYSCDKGYQSSCERLEKLP